MELIKLVTARRSRWSDLLHAALNTAYATLLFFLITPEIDLPLLALALVFISKWRVVAVRPRFWFANFQANFVDFMVGVSVWALMMLTATASPWVAAMLAVLFAVWLIAIKPHSTQRWILLQAGIAQFVSLLALYSFAHTFEFGQFVKDSTFLTVVIAWAIGYMSARHALTAFHNEDERAFISLAWGFVVAELSWLFHHWTIAYAIYQSDSIRADAQLMIPQGVIIITLLSYTAVNVYALLHHSHENRDMRRVRSSITFSAAVIVILLLFFSGLIDVTSLT